MRGMIVAAIAVLTLAACGSDRGLRDYSRSSGGPDEFTVLPNRPLDIPTNMAALPQPTPGAANLADPNPVGDAIALLGGTGAARGGIPATDAALINSATRYGVAGDIRATLAAEDSAFRKRRERGLFNGGADRYFRAYANMALDAYAELIRFKALGVQVPSAPPAN